MPVQCTGKKISFLSFLFFLWNDAIWMLKSTWIPTRHWMGLVSWSLRLFPKNHLLEVGLTHNWETMTLRTLTTASLFYLFTCEDPHEQRVIEIALGWGPDHTWVRTTLEEDPWPHYMTLGVFWDGLWTLSFGLPQFHGHGSWLVCEVALRALHEFYCILNFLVVYTL